MSDLALGQVVELIAKVTNDVRHMGELHSEQTRDLMRVMDDLAAALMAVQAITAVQYQANPVDAQAVHRWLSERMSPEADGTKKARNIADLLMGKTPSA